MYLEFKMFLLRSAKTTKKPSMYLFIFIFQKFTTITFSHHFLNIKQFRNSITPLIHIHI
jgi:hypothetical protein